MPTGTSQDREPVSSSAHCVSRSHCGAQRTQQASRARLRSALGPVADSFLVPQGNLKLSRITRAAARLSPAPDHPVYSQNLNGPQEPRRSGNAELATLSLHKFDSLLLTVLTLVSGTSTSIKTWHSSKYLWTAGHWLNFEVPGSQMEK